MKSKESIIPLLLTILSLILLGGCLVLWNLSNYNAERIRFQNELESDLTATISEVNFDRIYSSFISIVENKDSLNNKKVDIAKYYNANDSFDISMLKALPKIILNEANEIDLEIAHEFPHSNTFKNHSMDFFIDSFLLDSTKEKSGFIYSLKDKNQIQSLDSTSLNIISTTLESKLQTDKQILNSFADRIKNKDYLFQFEQLGKFEPKGFIISYTFKGIENRTFSLDIFNYKYSLIKKILPSILISAVLLFLTTFTFWILVRSRKKQEELVHLKNEFISNMTHELKTPISTVGVALEAISTYGENLEESKKAEYIGISKQELGRLSLLVDKVLKMASYDNDHSLLKKENIDLVIIIDNILKSMSLLFEKKNASIIVNHSLDQALILGDNVHISNVIYNIIDNALKYSLNRPKVEIDLVEESHKFKLTIKDSGKGIPKEYKEKVFDRFFRTPENNRHNVKGHGLGLSYSKDIIEKHGGEIFIESEEMVGTEVTIKLPIYVKD